MPFEAMRGFRDYPPPDAGARSELRHRMRAVARRSGFTELETPSVESLELLTAKSGTEIADELWAFADKGGRPVALVPESTPSVARIFAARAKAEPVPVKWFTLARIWRYEEPQAGRTREFGQFNLDIFGVPGVTAEVELLATAAALMDAVGATGLYGFRLNDRELSEGIADALGVVDRPRYLRALDRSRKMPPTEFDHELAACGLGADGIDQLRGLRTAADDRATSPLQWLDRVAALDLPAPGRAAVDRLRELLRLAERAGIADRLRLDPTVVRGLAYYTATVFEAYALDGDLRALFGGGRYDRLIEQFGGPPTPAAGVAIGDQTLEILLRSHDRWPEGEPALDTYVVAVTSAEVALATEWVGRLRRAGIAADHDLLGRSLSRQLKEADRRRARRALILGPKEIERGVAVERDLATGAQHEVPWSEVVPPA